MSLDCCRYVVGGTMVPDWYHCRGAPDAGTEIASTNTTTEKALATTVAIMPSMERILELRADAYADDVVTH